jgi:FtsZ-interacting cell division protein YlmF
MAGIFRRFSEWAGIGSPADHYDDYDGDDYTDLVEYTSDVDETPAPEPQEPDNVTPLDRHRPRVVSSRRMDEIAHMKPHTFMHEAPSIAERYREGTPILINMTDMPTAEAQRLIDFCGGLAAGLEGEFTRSDSKVFLLTPATVKVVNDEDQEDEPLRVAQYS